MKKNYCTQCEFRQPTDDNGGYISAVAWIPSEFAKKGKIIRIDGEEGVWLVTQVWATKEESWVIDRERDYKNQREVSDV